MKILIRGAGDLATGIAARLYRCGHAVLMTEIPQPLTVRRTVAFSRAVCEGRARVEEMEAVLAGDYEEAQRILKQGDIPVLVDEAARVREQFRPDVLVDAVIAKRNLGTKITDAPLVVGVGPGFTAGEDCHCVVETKRGHTLGRVIWEGCAIPNTGVPGNVGGYTKERLLRASADGRIHPMVSIGDRVEKGQIAAYTGNVPVYAAMSGLVRGMLQEGASVQEGMKIGDIDARCENAACYTISEKALAVGGGVLEAAETYRAVRGRYSLVILAAGLGSRFGADKLSCQVRGRAVYQYMLEKAAAFPGVESFIVTGNEAIMEEAGRMGVTPVSNREAELGISHSLQLGLRAALQSRPRIEGVLFAVCDQPGLRISTIQRIWNQAAVKPGRIICAGQKQEAGNPVLWPAAFFPELMSLTGDVGGRAVLARHMDQVEIVEARETELRDIDRREDLEEIWERRWGI